MDDEVGGVAPISDEQIEKLELSFGYSDDDFESLASAFRNAWPSIICRLRSQASEMAELRQARHDVLDEVAAERDAARAELAELRALRDGLMAASNNHAAGLAEAKRERTAASETNREILVELGGLREQIREIVAERDALRADLERVRASRPPERIYEVLGEQPDGTLESLQILRAGHVGGGMIQVKVALRGRSDG